MLLVQKEKSNEKGDLQLNYSDFRPARCFVATRDEA